MKTSNLFAIIIIALLLANCCKQDSEDSEFRKQLHGTYMQVGFKNDLFEDWSYTSAGPVFTISYDSITEPYATKYQVIDAETIYMFQQQTHVNVSFGDTIIFAFQNGDSTKLVKL